MSIPAPILDIHLLKSGALLRSQPVTPPNSNIGDKAVPKPNKTAKITLSIGAANVAEYKRSAIKGGHTINPRVKPKEKARMSNLVDSFVTPKFLSFSVLQLQEGDLVLRRICVPIAMVTMPKANEEYF